LEITKVNKIELDGVYADVYNTDTGCTILVSNEFKNTHLSISHPERYPHWEEIKKARYEILREDKDCVMFLPPKKEYVNMHQNCFHLYEVSNELLLDLNKE